MNASQKNSKTIVYTGGFELPDRNAAAHRVLAVAKMFRDCGFRVILVGTSRTAAGTPVLHTRSDCQGFESYAVAYPRTVVQWGAYLTDIGPLQQVIQTLGDVDAVLCYNYPAIAFSRLRQWCRHRGSKVLADCTEWYNVKEVAPLLRPVKGTDTWLRMHVVQKRLDGMIVISRYLQRYYQNCSQVVYVPPLVDISDAKWNCTPMPRGPEVTFVYVGNPGHKDKLGDILEAIAAVNKISPCILWVIGATREDFLRLNPEWKDRELGGCVAFLGRLPHEESLAYLKSADCSFIIRDNTRTNNAGFPTKFVEAVTVGTDVIASDISDLHEYVGRVPGLYLAKQDLKAAVRDYVTKHSGIKAKKRASDLFDYHNWMKEIYKLVL